MHKDLQMTNPAYRNSSASKQSRTTQSRPSSKTLRKRTRTNDENSDVLISAVISSYLLTHLHHVLQRAEYGALKDGRSLQAANFAQLRKVLCMDARSMQDASARGMRDPSLENSHDSLIKSKAA